jgi:hypothetical protein
MKNNRRKNLRLPHYDYSQPGAYFITIVTFKRMCLFGSIIDGKMILDDAGKMIDRICQELPQFIPKVIMERYVIMPNHFHAFVSLHMVNVGATLRGCPGQTEICPYGFNKLSTPSDFIVRCGGTIQIIDDTAIY